MKYNKIISIIILLFIFSNLFGQKKVGNTNPKIKLIKKLELNKNDYLNRITYEKYNLDGKITNYTMLEGDSTQIMRYSYKYNNKGLLRYEESYDIADRRIIYV